jgi:hypothetical protein
LGWATLYRYSVNVRNAIQNATFRIRIRIGCGVCGSEFGPRKAKMTYGTEKNKEFREFHVLSVAIFFLSKILLN